MEKKRGGSNKKVMVAIDESKCSYKALMWVLDNLKELIANTSLVIFASQPTPNCNYIFAAQLGATRIYCPVSATPELISSIQEQNRKVAFGLLEKAKNICASRGVKAETITEAGEPRELICKAVQMYKINLLVIGDDDVGPLQRLFLGSQSNYCLKNAKCPVLVVKKPE